VRIETGQLVKHWDREADWMICGAICIFSPFRKDPAEWCPGVNLSVLCSGYWTEQWNNLSFHEQLRALEDGQAVD
jgi:hypothetical protein